MFVLGIYQGSGNLRDVEHNLQILREVSLMASQKGVHLLVFPEMWLTGYNIKEDIPRLAEAMDGPSFQVAAQIAREHQIHLIYGYPERCGDHVYNSAVCISPTGHLLQNYRKTHLYGPDEKKYFTPGTTILPPVTIHGRQVGLGICYDIEFPEFARTHAFMGTEVLAIPTACWDSMVANLILAPARAAENNIVVAYVNRAGPENGEVFNGNSTVTNELGHTLAHLAHQNSELAIVTLAKPKIHFPYLPDRVPKLYSKL